MTEYAAYLAHIFEAQDDCFLSSLPASKVIGQAALNPSSLGLVLVSIVFVCENVKCTHCSDEL